MVESLPRNTRLKLEQTLGQWRHWHCDPALEKIPHAEQQLAGGLSNHSVLVAAGERRFVVRVDGINPALHGLSRQTEWRVLQEAGRRHLAPMPRYFNPDLGTLVCDFLAADDEQSYSLDDLAHLLHEIHSLPAIHTRLDLRERILRYERQVQAKAVQAALGGFHPAIMQILDHCAQQETNRVVCHNDLLRANRLYSGGQLRALDWEYAAMASPWYELGVIVAGDSLDDDAQDQLLALYLQREATPGERQRVCDYSCVYRYLELLWLLATDQALCPPELVQSKTAALARSLEPQSIL